MKQTICQKVSEGKPPTSITGAENTKSGLEGLIDWCAFTLPFDDPSQGVEQALQVLQMPYGDFVEMPHGGNGYKSQLRSGNISIFYDGKPGMGVHVVMTGQGCREYESRHGDKWANLLRSVIRLGGWFSRLDVAIDDYRGRFTLKHIVDKVLKHEARTLFGRKKEDGSRRPFRIVMEPDFESAPGANDGLTVYAGSVKSNIMLRFYDKAVQRGVKFPWLRAEIQCRNERADEMAKHIAEGKDLGKIAAGVLSYYVNFVEPNEDSNPSRWPVSSWWSEFLGDVEKLRLAIEKTVKTIEEKMEWVDRQISTTLALIGLYLNDKGRDVYDFLSDLLIDGEKRLKPRHLVLL